MGELFDAVRAGLKEGLVYGGLFEVGDGGGDELAGLGFCGLFCDVCDGLSEFADGFVDAIDGKLALDLDGSFELLFAAQDAFFFFEELRGEELYFFGLIPELPEAELLIGIWVGVVGIEILALYEGAEVSKLVVQGCDVLESG